MSVPVSGAIVGMAAATRHSQWVHGALVWLMAAAVGAAEDAPNFNFEVLPILSDRCFRCHGTDAKERKKNLRLDQRESALKVIKPGDPAGSKLIQRIFSTDPEERMPPVDSHLELSAAEKEMLRRWVAAGAEYRGHWAFQPIRAPAVPEPPASASASHTEIDSLVQARLENEGLPFQPEASPERLLRRLSFDLTGLPPTLAELDAFETAVRSDREPAVQNEITRLLASPHFGERMAVDWLDVARFADTFGYQSDVAMNVWPYRDWVIKAFNDNLPFDQFITWQLAGDLLPGATRDQQLATAFNRLHRQTNEGGSVEEEYRVEYNCDRVETFGLAFLGLTVQCAKCHDHKYDPITQRDYYSLFACFQNIDESGLYSHFTDAVPTPTLRLSSPQQNTELALAEAAIAKSEARLATMREECRSRFVAWLETVPTPDKLPIPGEVGRFSCDEIKERKLPNEVNAKESGVVFEDVSLVEGKRGQALWLSGENNVNFGLGGEFTRDDPFAIALWIKTPDVKDRAVVFHRSKAWTDAASNGYELLLENGRLSAALIHFWPGNALRVVATDPLPVNEWTHVVWSYDGSSRARGLRLFVDGLEAAVGVVRDGLTKDINRGGEKRLTLGQRFRDRGFKGGMVDDLRLFSRALTALEARRLHGEFGPGPQAARVTQSTAVELFDYYLAAHDEAYGAGMASLKKLRQRRSQLADGLPEIMTMRELPAPKPGFILFRGAYDQPRDAVTAGPPAFLPPPPPGAPANRLGLAQWVTAAENPLTARVITNRLWQSFFGRGLVGTAEDFGLQGEAPTHPELLDSLARRLLDSGWDFKALVRMIVSSRTYRQDSTCPPETRARDPQNRLLSRAPSFRLSVEQIRDQALACAGMLDRTIGGPSVDPDKTNRRSLYTFWKRTMPDVRMELFDMAKREVCTARRPLTNTPLQALTMLNEPRFKEWARQIAATTSTEPPGDAALIRIFRTLTSRRPSERHLAILRQLRDEQTALSGRTGAEAETHGLFAVAQALLNFDECVMKR